ncbi:hypothetical protein V8D89_000367 [Ganoderma adspersum]
MPGGPHSECSSISKSSRITSWRNPTDSPRVQDIPRKLSAYFTPSAIRTALAVCAVFLLPVVGADVPLSLQDPSEVILCQPINLTWTGGTPPYRLDVEPLVDNAPNKTANGRNIGVNNTWFLWTPDFPQGSVLQISIEGSGTSPAASVIATEVPSSDSRCLNTTSATSLAPTSTSLVSTLSTSVVQPSATSSPAILASSRSGLSKGAIAGIAVACTLIGIGFIGFIAWYLLRRRSRDQHLEKGAEGTIVSHTLPYSDPSSTLVSDDRSKLTSPMSAFGSSSDASEDHDPLRPTPYLVARESIMIPGAGGKKHIRELSDPTSASSTGNMSMSMSDVRETIANPPQLGSADGQDAGHGGGGGYGDRGVMRSDASSAPPPSRSLGLGFEDVAASDVASNSGEATLPPPYSALLGGRRDDEPA